MTRTPHLVWCKRRPYLQFSYSASSRNPKRHSGGHNPKRPNDIIILMVKSCITVWILKNTVNLVIIIITAAAAAPTAAAAEAAATAAQPQQRQQQQQQQPMMWFFYVVKFTMFWALATTNCGNLRLQKASFDLNVLWPVVLMGCKVINFGFSGNIY